MRPKMTRASLNRKQIPLHNLPGETRFFYPGQKPTLQGMERMDLNRRKFLRCGLRLLGAAATPPERESDGAIVAARASYEVSWWRTHHPRPERAGRSFLRLVPGHDPNVVPNVVPNDPAEQTDLGSLAIVHKGGDGHVLFS